MGTRTIKLMSRFSNRLPFYWVEHKSPTVWNPYELEGEEIADKLEVVRVGAARLV